MEAFSFAKNKQIKISGPGKADVEMEQAREFYTGLGSNIKSDQNTIIDV